MIRKRFLSMLVLLLTVTGAVAQSTYKVTVRNGTEDAGNWTIAPAEAAAGTQVKATYQGTKKVKSVKAVKKAAAVAYTMAADATAEDRGKLICTDGHIHTYNEDAACTAGRVAMITYVGSATGEAEPYNHGLAMALCDADNGTHNLFKWKLDYTDAGHIKQTDSNNFTIEGGLQYNNNAHNNDDYPAFKAAIANNGTAAPIDCSAWFLPTAYQWKLMLTAAGSYIALRNGFSSIGGTDLKSDPYWSSSEYDSSHAWDCDFYDESLYQSPSFKYYPFYIRSVVAF